MPGMPTSAVNRLGQTPPARDAALDDEKVQVTVWTGRAARGRSEEDHAIGLGHGHDALEGRFKSRHAVTILRVRPWRTGFGRDKSPEKYSAK